MVSTAELKARLKRIYPDPLQPDEEEILDLTYHMLPHIGTTDPQLRDDLIFYLLATWIENSRLSKERMLGILAECLSKEKLFLHIEEPQSDAVFTRSFTVLTITAILWHHNHVSAFLKEKEIKKIKQSVFDYAKMEQDFRGYVPDKGWAHSVAHLADCLNEIALCSLADQDDMTQMLNIIRRIMRSKDIAFIYSEDERMVVAILSIIKRNLLDKKEILNWLEELCELDYQKRLPNDDWHAKNIKDLCRSLYFQTFEDRDFAWLSDAVLHHLKDKDFRDK